MAPNQKTLRVTGLPLACTEDDVRQHLLVHVRDNDRPSVVGIGPICRAAIGTTNQTTVTFSSTDASTRALRLSRDARILRAAGGGIGEINLDDKFDGITTLQCLFNPKTGQPDIDIIALHGLTGHAWKTFTAVDEAQPGAFIDRETNWLQKYLARLLNGHQRQKIYARVMTFGYNADVWMTTSIADLDVPINNLLWSLAEHRQNEPDRPLFFIAHSLGGIVVKEAIKILADNALAQSLNSHKNSQQKYIFPVKGCIFFGVPHSGAKTAKFASKFLENLGKVFHFNARNVHDLKPQSARLTRVAEEFETTRSNLDLPVASFYETKNLSQLTGPVVSRDSAFLDYPGRPNPFGIDRDHQEMIKFRSESEEGLKAAVLFLAELATQATDQKDARHKLESTAIIQRLTTGGQAGVENRLTALHDYDTVFLIDDSSSMAGPNWDLVKQILDVCTPVAAFYDRDGIDINFFNNQDRNQPKVKDPRIAVQIHHGVMCDGGSPLVDRVSRRLKSYYKGYAQAKFADDYKRLNLIVITDGEPDDEPDADYDTTGPTKPVFKMLQEKLVKFAKNLDSPSVDAEANQVGIQFCQIGNDREATVFFEFLDDLLKRKEDLERDMIDTIKCVSDTDLTEDFYRKLLTGAIDKRWDKKKLDEQPQALSSLVRAQIAGNGTQLPYRSASSATNSSSLSQANTIVAPSRAISFPNATSLNALPEESPAESSVNSQPYASPPRQGSGKIHDAHEADNVSQMNRQPSLRGWDKVNHHGHKAF